MSILTPDQSCKYFVVVLFVFTCKTHNCTLLYNRIHVGTSPLVDQIQNLSETYKNYLLLT